MGRPLRDVLTHVLPQVLCGTLTGVGQALRDADPTDVEAGDSEDETDEWRSREPSILWL